MTIRALAPLNIGERPKAFEASPPPPSTFQRWTSALALSPQAVSAATDEGQTVIDILDVIGRDPWTGEGVDAAYVVRALRNAGDVLVNINSPGGDFFEGAAIYEALRAHKGTVTVNILGLAASAASLVAMAGDDVRIGKTAFVMIHNCWGLVVGNRHDMEKARQMCEQIDTAMAGLYSDRTGIDLAEIGAMMDADTWIGSRDAIAKKFADGLLEESTTVESAQALAATPTAMHAQRHMDAILAEQGYSRRERRALFAEIKRGKHDAAALETGTQDAAKLGEITSAMRDTLLAFS